MGTLVPVGTVLFSDDFSTDTQVNPAEWSYVQYEPSNNPAFLGRTETNQSLPLIVNGAAHLTIDTYLPGQGAGVAFAGTAIYTQQTFQPGATGIVFTVTARLDQTEAGLVGGIFPYMLLDSATTDHNEIDTELVSNDPANLSVNTYADQPLGAGNPQTVSLPSGDSLTQLNTYQMVWTAGQITWYVNGEQVAETTSNVPTGSMPLYLNFWVPDGGSTGWQYAYNAALQPVSTAAADTTYGFDVTSVQVAQLVPCFAAGTRIATASGEVLVETLCIGDQVRTLQGNHRPIVWIGVGRVLATRGRRNAATPVIVRKGALAGNVPHRDLRVTKGHSLYLDGVLIPVEFLVNHCSILWDDRAQEVDVFHIELETHDVLLADGAPAESYPDDGNRWLFRNANAGWNLPPQPPCAPVLTGGPVVDAVWRRLLDRAGPRNRPPLTHAADLHVLFDGRRLDAAEHAGNVYVFHLPSPPKDLRIASRAAVPAELGTARDFRALGVALRRIVVRKGTKFRTIKADDARLSDGFHTFEPDNGFRWTDGGAVVPGKLFEGFTGPLELVLYVGATAAYVDQGQELRVA